MAKKRKRKYSPGVEQDVEREMRRFKRGTARSGPGWQSRQSEELQAGDRDCSFGGAQGRQAGTEEEIASAGVPPLAICSGGLTVHDCARSTIVMGLDRCAGET
jgi:hypothetical protein